MYSTSSLKSFSSGMKKGDAPPTTDDGPKKSIGGRSSSPPRSSRPGGRGRGLPGGMKPR